MMKKANIQFQAAVFEMETMSGLSPTKSIS